MNLIGKALRIETPRRQEKIRFKGTTTKKQNLEPQRR
jgi:hypothetical protein